MSPAPGRYRYDAATRSWKSGATVGAVIPVPTIAARMYGGVLMSTAGPTTPDPVQFVAFAPFTIRPNYAPIDGGTTNIGNRAPFSELTQVGAPGGSTQYNLTTGMDVSKLLIWGEVVVSGKGTMRDIVIVGPLKATYDSGLIRGSSRNLQGSLFEWITADGSNRESPWTDGIKGGNYTIRYSIITRSNDGIAASAPIGNGVVECCRIVDGYYTAWYNTATGAAYPGNPPSPSDMKTHGDGVQIQGRSGWVIRSNYIGGQPSSGWSTSTLMANRDPKIPAQLAYQQNVDAGKDYPNSGTLVQNNTGTDAASKVGALIEGNWYLGGAAALNLNGGLNGDTLSGVIVRNNRFIPDGRGRTAGGFKIFMSDNCQATVTGNVWDDTGALVTIHLYGGGTAAQAS